MLNPFILAFGIPTTKTGILFCFKSSFSFSGPWNTKLNLTPNQLSVSNWIWKPFENHVWVNFLERERRLKFLSPLWIAYMLFLPFNGAANIYWDFYNLSKHFIFEFSFFKDWCAELNLQIYLLLNTLWGEHGSWVIGFLPWPVYGS